MIVCIGQVKRCQADGCKHLIQGYGTGFGDKGHAQEQQRHADRNQRGHRTQIERVQNQRAVTFIQIKTTPLPKPNDQLQHRDDKTTGEHQPAPHAGGQRFTAAQVIQRLAARPFIGGANGAAGTSFAVQHHHHGQQQQAGQLSGAGQAVKAVPRLINSGGESIEIKHRNGAKIRQGFHDGKRQPGTNRRARHGQRDPPKCPPRA